MRTVTLPIIAAAVAASFGMAGTVGTAQAEPINIWSVSQQNAQAQVETVQHRSHRRGHRHRHHYRGHRHGSGAAIAAGAIGAIAAGAIIAGSQDRYYDDGYYYDGPPPRTYERDDYCLSNNNKPSHYPAPPGC